jgi:hypothetical protein
VLSQAVIVASKLALRRSRAFCPAARRATIGCAKVEDMFAHRSVRPLAVVAAIAAGLVAGGMSLALAEDVVTKTDGAKLRGKVLSDTPDEVRIKTAGGVIAIPRGEVSTVDREKDLASELAARNGALEKKPSAKGYFDLARWCEEHELFIAQAECLQRVIKLEPDNEAARHELGYRRLKGKWVSETEWYADQGWAQIDGRWVSPAEKEKLDQGLMKWGDDEWVTREEHERRSKDATARAEKERQGIPTKPGESPRGAESSKDAPATPEKGAKAARKGKEDKPRFLDGKLLYTKSRETIVRTLEKIGQEAVPPLVKPKGAEFEPTPDAAQAAALRRLRQYRYLSDVPYDVDLNPDYAVSAAAAVKLLDLVGHLTHTPKKPNGCPENLYKAGYHGTSHSNLYQASMGPTCTASVDAFIFDSDQSNIDRVGHRRWCLNATQKMVAFASYKQFAAMYALDQGRQAGPYDAVLYPARGYFPISHWQKNAAWSAHLSPRFSPVQNQGDVKVTVAPMDANFKKGSPVEIEYFHVDSQGFGFGSSCVIFKPKANVADGARYWVEIKGLKENGQDATLEYLVEFFAN